MCRVGGVGVGGALSFGLNGNLVHEWRRGRGYKPMPPATAEALSQAQPQFIPLSLPEPAELAPVVGACEQAIRPELKRGAFVVSWPMAASSECTAWLRELLR